MGRSVPGLPDGWMKVQKVQTSFEKKTKQTKHNTFMMLKKYNFFDFFLV